MVNAYPLPVYLVVLALFPFKITLDCKWEHLLQSSSYMKKIPGMNFELINAL